MGQQGQRWSNEWDDILNPYGSIQPIGHRATGVRVIPKAGTCERLSTADDHKLLSHGDSFATGAYQYVPYDVAVHL